jgi:hypothetical protein
MFHIVTYIVTTVDQHENRAYNYFFIVFTAKNYLQSHKDTKPLEI